MAQGVIICGWSFGREPDLVRGKSMLTCPKCHAGVPEGMRFCLQCGASLAPTPSPAAPPVGADPPCQRRRGSSGAVCCACPTGPCAPLRRRTRGHTTVPLKIAPTPVMAPRAGAAARACTPQPRRPDGGNRRRIVEEIFSEAGYPAGSGGLPFLQRAAGSGRGLL